jgi:hypothetical protein
MSSTEDFEVAYQRVERLLASIRDRQLNLEDADPINLVNADDPAVAMTLRRIARSRDVNDADAMMVQAAIDEETSKNFQHRMQRRDECLSASEQATLFRVENSARRSIDIIASSSDCARFLSHRSGHVHDEKNTTVFRYNNEYIKKLKSKSPALWRAVRAGVPGVVAHVGNHVIVTGAQEVVYTPISVVHGGSSD